jgi:class 3 adenylate cyclase
MFCDLVGSTALAELMDPEDTRDLIKAYQACCTEVIERYSGYVSRLMGDGILGGSSLICGSESGWPQAWLLQAI